MPLGVELPSGCGERARVDGQLEGPEAGGARRRRRRADALPDVEGEAVREAAARAQIAEADVRDVGVVLESDHVGVEASRRLEVGDVQVEMTDGRSRRQGAVEISVLE